MSLCISKGQKKLVPPAVCFGNPLAIYRTRAKKSDKKSLAASGKSGEISKNYFRESGKSLEKVLKKTLSRLFRDFFETFSRLTGVPGLPGSFFLTLGASGLHSPRDSCKGSLGSQCVLKGC